MIGTGTPADMARQAALMGRRRARFEAARTPGAALMAGHDMVRAALRRHPQETALAARRLADLAESIDRGDLL